MQSSLMLQESQGISPVALVLQEWSRIHISMEAVQLILKVPRGRQARIIRNHSSACSCQEADAIYRIVRKLVGLTGSH
jgi:hypothetical protein